jgi:hypothetical protein
MVNEALPKRLLARMNSAEMRRSSSPSQAGWLSDRKELGFDCVKIRTKSRAKAE